MTRDGPAGAPAPSRPASPQAAAKYPAGPPDPAAPPAALEARHLTHRFFTAEGVLDVLDGVSLCAGSGELVAIIGPSGCGKSTLFNIVAGLLEPASGSVLVHGREVEARPGLVGYMPQKDLLLPWKSVLDNAALPLELRGMTRRHAREEVRPWLDRFGLAGFERYRPAALSGGMRQRVALLRTFLSGRDTLLLDEPFGALDALTRADMQEWLLEVWDTFRKSVVLVTHDVDEAIFLADRVYVMSPRPGRIAAEIEISLARPRAYDDVTTTPLFAALRRELLARLRRQDGRRR
ncbi:MAG TPA: ABC transporter ATP-binding protein [Chloroflexota bacterium]|nr:ABC transporter ATP-binding protein [Chloroflexota bacterium]